MPALQVRDFPDDLYEQLRALSARNHRSIAQQTIACVEQFLKLSDSIGSQSGEVLNDSLIPANVKEASMRAAYVNPFAWFESKRVETEEAAAAREKKWRRLGSDAAALSQFWTGEAPSLADIAAIVREEREARDASILSSVYGVHPRGEGEAL